MEKKIRKIHLIFSFILGLTIIFELVYLFCLKPFYFPLDFPQPQPLPVEEQIIEKKIASLSLEEKVGALFIVGFNGSTLTDDTRDFINQHHFRHFLLLGRNINNKEQLISLTAELKNATSSAIPSLITIDQEGGQVARLNFEELDNTSQAAITSVPQAYKIGRDRGGVLKDLGINVNFAPVVEVIRDEDSYLARLNRAFPGDEDQVFRFSQAMIKGYQDSAIIAVAKHFPGGLGRKKADPHQTLPRLEVGFQDLNQDLLPFQDLIKQGRISALMTTHILYSQIDENNPVTTSEKFISAILRQELGFKGVIISDDLVMRGLGSINTIEDSAIAAFNAGHDLLIVSGPTEIQDRVYQNLLQTVKQGEITEERLDQSLRRLLRLSNGE